MQEIGKENPAQEYSPRQRFKICLTTLLLFGVVVYFSIRFALDGMALSSSCRGLQIVLYAFSALLMAAAVRWIFVVLRRKQKAGRFLMTRAEVAAKQAEYRKIMGAGKPFWPQAWIWSIPVLLLAVFMGTGVLAFVFAIKLGRTKLLLLIPLLVLAAVVIAFPAIALFKAVRRKLKTGSFLPSEQELDARRARCQKPKTLRQKNVLAVLCWFNAILWTDMAISHLHRRTITTPGQWVVAVLWSGMALGWTWQIFHPTVPLCALPDVPEEPQEPQDTNSSE